MFLKSRIEYIYPQGFGVEKVLERKGPSFGIVFSW